MPVKLSSEREELLGQHPPINRAAVFGHVVPGINYAGVDGADPFTSEMVNDAVISHGME